MEGGIQLEEKCLEAAGVGDEGSGRSIPDLERSSPGHDGLIDETVSVRIGLIFEDAKTSESGVCAIDRDPGFHPCEFLNANPIRVVAAEITLVCRDKEAGST